MIIFVNNGIIDVLRKIPVNFHQILKNSNGEGKNFVKTEWLKSLEYKYKLFHVWPINFNKLENRSLENRIWFQGLAHLLYIATRKAKLQELLIRG